MDQADIQNLTSAFNQLGATLRTNAGSVGQSMARLRVEMQRGTGTVQSNTAALQRLISDFENLDEETRKSTMGVKMLADQTAMAGQIMRDSIGQMSAGLVKGGLSEAVDYITKQLYTSIANYQEGATGMQAAFNNQNAALESQIRILERLSSGATMTAEALMLIPHPLARFGAMVAAGVGGLSSLAKQLSEKQLEAFKVFQKEMTITSQSFDIMQKSGVLFQSGFADVRATAGALQLNMDELSRTVAQNKKELSDFGGSVTGGVRKLKLVGDAFTRLAAQGRDLRKDLEYAGYSQQEQTEGMIDYMEMLNRTGRLRGMSDEQIATQGTEYLKVQKAITAYTGEEAKAAQRRAQEASEQLAVQAKLRKSQDPQAMEKFQGMVKMMPEDMSKALQQMVAFDGTVVDKNLNILFSQSPTRKKVMDEAYADLSSGMYDQAQLIARQEERMKKYGPVLEQEALAMGDGIGQAALAGGKYTEVATLAQNQIKEAQKGQASLVEEIGTTVEQMKRFTQQVDATGKAIDPLREASINASRAMREDIPGVIAAMGKTINEYVQSSFGEKGLMGMAKAVREANQQSITLINEVLKKAADERAAPILRPGGGAAGAMSDAVNYLIEATKKLTTASGNLLEATRKLRHSGTLGMTGSLFEPQDAFVKIAKGETVLTPGQLENLVKGTLQLPIASDMLKPDSSRSAGNTDDVNKIIDTLTSSLSGLTTQISTSNQINDSKLSELVNTMRDKSIMEDMKTIAEETAENTRRMANALA